MISLIKKDKYMEQLEKFYTEEELKKYDGSNDSLPIYVAVKGIIFDVSKNRQSYALGQGYNVFAGKDASKVYYYYLII